MTVVVVLWMAFWAIAPVATGAVFLIGAFGRGRWAWRRYRWFWCVGFAWGLLALMHSVVDRDWFGCATGFAVAGLSAWALVQRDSERMEVSA